jgi:glycosyltransferase 2 family protein
MMANRPPVQNKKRWIIVFAILLAIVLLYFSLKGISWNEVWASIIHADGKLLLVGLGLTLFNLGMRGLRWGVLLSAEMKISPVTMFWATVVGYLGNMTLPARAGEVLRSAALSRKTGLSLGYIFATALTERVLDVLILVMIALISAPTISNLPEWMGQTMPIMAVLGGAAVLFLVAAPRFERLFGKIVQIMPIPPKWKESLILFINRFLMGGKAFLHPLRAGGFLGLSAVIWLIDGIIGMLVGNALGLTLSLAQVMLFLVGLGLSSAIPSTPGYVGVYQFVAVTLLPLFGISKSQALSFVLILQAISVVVVVISGLIGAWRLGIRKLQINVDEGAENE